MKRLLALTVLLASTTVFAAETASTSASAVVGKVGNVVFTQEQMEKELKTSLYDLEKRIYQMKKKWIQGQARNVLFDEAAKKAGLSRADWEQKEIGKYVTGPSEAELAESMKKYGADKAEPAQQAQMRQQLSNHLMGLKRQAREEEVYKSLSKASPVMINLPKPAVAALEIPVLPDDPIKGPKNAPITMIEYTDFQCPYCKMAQGTIEKLEQNYKGKLRLISRQYPLPMHSRAKPASEAALCARDQGKFWQYRELVFKADQLEDTDLHAIAKKVGLNQKKFEACYASHKYSAEIDAGMRQGQKLGVSGTPTFFINGQTIVGGNYEDFKEVFDEILDSQKS